MGRHSGYLHFVELGGEVDCVVASDGLLLLLGHCVMRGVCFGCALSLLRQVTKRKKNVCR
jgi:hypothetical protein